MEEVNNETQLDKLKALFESLEKDENAHKLANIILHFEMIIMYESLFEVKQEEMTDHLNWLQKRYEESKERCEKLYVRSAYNIAIIQINTLKSFATNLNQEMLAKLLEQSKAQLSLAVKELGGDLEWISGPVTAIFDRLTSEDMSSREKIRLAVEIKKMLDFGVERTQALVKDIVDDINFEDKETVEFPSFNVLPSVICLRQFLDAMIMDVYYEFGKDFFILVSDNVPEEEQVEFLLGLHKKLSGAKNIQNQFGHKLAKLCNRVEVRQQKSYSDENLFSMLSSVKEKLKNNNQSPEEQKKADNTWILGTDAVVGDVKNSEQKPMIMELYDAVVKAFQPEEENELEERNKVVCN